MTIEELAGLQREICHFLRDRNSNIILAFANTPDEKRRGGASDLRGLTSPPIIIDAYEEGGEQG